MPTIAPHIIDEVRLATDVVDLVSEYVALKKSGRNFFGLCPFHAEKSPSFSVNPDKQIFHCFGCSAGGNVFMFIQKLEGVSFPEAVRKLAKRAGIAIPEPEVEDRAASQEKEALYFVNQLAAEFFQHVLFSEKGRPGREYMHQRGFADEALQAFGVGFAPQEWEAFYDHARKKSVNPETLVKAGLVNAREKEGKGSGYYDRFRHRVMFPIHNISGRVVAFGGRRIIDDESPKYINSPETAVYHKGHLLYAFPLAKDHLRAQDCLIVVEGYLDVMRMHLCGFNNTVATSGTALTEQQARVIFRHTKNVILLFDSDAAGSSATLRGADILVENGLHVKVATLSAGDDPDSFLRKHPADEMRNILQHAPDLLEFKARSAPPATAEATPVSREEQLRSIVATLARMNDALQRQVMVHRMAEKLQVNESALWEEVARLRRASTRLRRAAPGQANPDALIGQTPPFAERSRAIELELLRIMILHWNAMQFIFSFMRVEDFHDAEARAMAEVFYSLLERDMPLEPEMLLHYFNEPQQAEFLSKVINEEAGRIHKEAIEIDYRRWSADCMARLQRIMIEDQRLMLMQQIKQGDASGRDVTELMQQLSEYDEQLRRIKPENFLLAA